MKATFRTLLHTIGPLGLALALGACATAHQAGEPFVAAAGADGVQHVAVLAGNYWFQPSRIVVKANVPVELSVRKEGGIVPHSFNMSSPEAGLTVDEDLSTEPRLIKFTPTRAGEFPFYCDEKLPLFPSHRSKGMEGVLEVQP
jgi:plastocyanin domain-containing protein